MSEPEWEYDLHFQISDRHSVQMLRRNITAKHKEWNLDLQPFFNLRSLIQHCPNTHDRTSVFGKLMRFNLRINELFVVVCDESGRRYDWNLGAQYLIQLTVWRVNNILDTLQLSVRVRERVILYLQTGGAHLLAILRPGKHADALIDANSLVAAFNESIPYHN